MHEEVEIKRHADFGQLLCVDTWALEQSVDMLLLHPYAFSKLSFGYPEFFYALMDFLPDVDFLDLHSHLEVCFSALSVN